MYVGLTNFLPERDRWAYSFCLSDMSAERNMLFYLTRRGHVISPHTGEAVRTAPTLPPVGHVASGEFPVT